MDLRDIVLAPVRAPRLVVRALDDLNAVAERARREPDPVDEVRARLDALDDRLRALTALLAEAIVEIRELRSIGTAIEGRGHQLVAEAAALLPLTEQVVTLSAEIITGGRDLVATGEGLERRSEELIVGGRDLVEVSERLDESMRVFRAALPQLLEGLDTAQQLESAVESVAETIEPLQGAAERVGRVTRRRSRG
jgi:hypothetical protein